MAEGNSNSGRQSRWLSITIPLLSAAFAVLGFVYFVGQRGGKIAEVVDWKEETAPRIERMDAKGTNSFEIFHEEYLRRQVQQERQVDQLEKDIHDKEMEDLKARILTLERKPCP
jgi:hypothetical protein